MSKSSPRVACLEGLYHDYLVDRDLSGFTRRVARRYTTATLERLLLGGPRTARRAAALAVGQLGDFSSNTALGRALNDGDRGVRMLAETSLRNVWCRDGSPRRQEQLAAVIRQNHARQFDEALRLAAELIALAPTIAEAWNQRAIAYYSLSRYIDSIHNCRQALELNPFHFGAAAGLGQCYLQLGNQLWALESFRRALQINPDLEGIRANVSALERKLKK